MASNFTEVSGCEEDGDSDGLRDLKTADSDPNEDKVWCPIIPARYLLAVLGFLGLFVSFSLRASLSVAVVAMVNSTEAGQLGSESPGQGERDNASGQHGGDEGELTESGKLNWDQTTQGLVLGSYYYGYVVTQLFGGWLAHRLGAKNVLGYGMLFSSLVTFLLPLAARAAAGYFIAIRVAQGVAESVLFPAMNTMWGAWAPIHERGRLVNFTYASTEVGTVLGLLTSGVLCRYGFAGGWPSVFYIHGVLGCVWVFLWMILVYESPAKHPRLSAQERAIFEKVYVPKQDVKTPWCRFLTSPALWAVAVNHFMTGWGFSSMATMLPTYMSSIQHFDIQQNGFLSSLPFLAQWLSLMGSSFLLDTLQSCRSLTTHRSRLLLNGVGGVLGASFYVGMGHVPERSHVTAVVVITWAMTCAALCLCCLRVAHLDLSPTHAGTLYGLTNGIACSSGFLAPALVGALTENQQTVSQWRIFFYLTAALYIVGPLIFCVFSTKGRQLEEEKDRKLEEEKTGSLITEGPEVSL